MKLLVVEDDPKIAGALRRGLEAEGFTVDTADNGDDGLWMAQESLYDVIILDIMLPRRNGFVVCRDLRRAGQQPLAGIEVGTLRVDSVARRVWSCGTEVELTHREFDVLEYLARRAGQVVSKLDLIAGVWAFDFAGDPNIVEVYVGRLRRKLGRPPGGTHHLTTVRGAGYRLDADG